MKISLTATIILSCIFTLTTQQNNKPSTNNEGELDEDELMRVTFYVDGLKGLWTGFERSFYLDSLRTVNPLCFSESMVKDIFFLVNFVEGHEDLTLVVKFVQIAARIFNENMS